MRHADDRTAGEQAQPFVAENFDLAVMREVEQGAIAEHDLGAAVARANDIALQQHERRLGGFGRLGVQFWVVTLGQVDDPGVVAEVVSQ